MTLYKDNPNLKIKIVTTVSGKKEYRKNCKYIKGKYYIINEDVFEINETWYRKESGFIEFDHELKRWTLKNSVHLIKGIVAFENNVPTIGYFSENPYNNCTAHYNGGRMPAISSELLLKNGYFENIATGEYYSEAAVGKASAAKMKTIRIEGNFQHKGYNIEDNKDEFALKKRLYADYNHKKSRDGVAFGKFLTDITYGLEIETSEGNVPNHLQNRLGLVACRDGSISAAEFVTVPMSGAKGLQNIKEISETLVPRCNVDINCSLHIHTGSIPLDRASLVTLYMLSYQIQDDVFKMFPYFKTDPRGIKRKNYCQKLKKFNINPCKDFSKVGFKEYIDNVYYTIYMFLSDGVPPDENHNRKRGEHPIKNKWDRHSRYYWANFQNMVFTNRGTAEWRIHTATLNSQKMINWLFITNAICKYAQDHQEEILSNAKDIKFVDVLNYYKEKYPNNERAAFLSDYLQAYYKERCRVFKRDIDRDDKLSDHELRTDKTYVFTYEGISSLV